MINKQENPRFVEINGVWKISKSPHKSPLIIYFNIVLRGTSVVAQLVDCSTARLEIARVWRPCELAWMQIARNTEIFMGFLKSIFDSQKPACFPVVELICPLLYVFGDARPSHRWNRNTVHEVRAVLGLKTDQTKKQFPSHWSGFLVQLIPIKA